jgi:hypothetical protein
LNKSKFGQSSPFLTLIKQGTSKDRFLMSLEVNMSNKNKQKRPKYTIKFKQDAAKVVNEKGY